MDAEMVSRIASEPEEHQHQREQLTRKLAVLEAGLEICKRYVGRSITSESFLRGLETELTEAN